MSENCTKLEEFSLYYDGECDLCVKTVSVLSRMDLRKRVRWIAYQTLQEPPAGLAWRDLQRSVYLEGGNGRFHEGFYAFRALCVLLPPLLPFAPALWVPGVAKIGSAVYRLIARNRGKILGGCRLADDQPDDA
ncbi:MAG: DUF393 domain-containing protein [Chloroflexi bacterium]|nr:DUF393 domain-containing protein [Chloroflexota bacterium]